MRRNSERAYENKSESFSAVLRAGSIKSYEYD